MYQPKKTTYAQVEYFLPGQADQSQPVGKDAHSWNLVRNSDALIHVLRNFSGYGFGPPTPLDDFMQLDQELIFADLVVAEKRIERLELDQKRGKKANPQELALLQQCHQKLDQEMPLRRFPELTVSPLLKGFAFLSSKPMLVLLNNADEDEDLPVIEGLTDTENCNLIRGKLEQELVQMSPEEVEEFLAEFNIGTSAMDRVIRHSYEFLGLISFFTVGKDEVRAWALSDGTEALDAADVVHSDMKKGFIRAEVVAFDDLNAAGTYAEARKQGTVRLEGKTYVVNDGDVITFRFNV
jgi:ribosome-binding ATPase YchF (GTP1/OBG family)